MAQDDASGDQTLHYGNAVAGPIATVIAVFGFMLMGQYAPVWTAPFAGLAAVGIGLAVHLCNKE